MGIFSQDKTTTNQTANNNQVGISQRDLNGVQLTRAGTGNKIEISTLDATALNTAAFTINHALDTVAQFSQSTLQGYQSALTANSEGGTTPVGIVDSGTGPPISLIDKILIGAAVVVGVLVLTGYFKKK